MIVMGFNGGTKAAEDDDRLFDYLHDAAAALIRDGDLICAIEEERLNRIKHTNCFPTQAILHCLCSAGVTWHEVDKFIYAGNPKVVTLRAQWDAMEDTVLPVPTDAHSFIASIFHREFDVDVSHKLSFCDHHEAHIWSAYGFSGFDEALVVSIDGEGDSRAGTVCTAQGTKLCTLRDYPISASLGNLYTTLIRFLGYTRFDEYKVMGLAPYGDRSVLRQVFSRHYRLLPNGEYTVDMAPDWICDLQASGVLTQARRRGGAFLRLHLDFAAALQEMLETIVLHILEHFRKNTGIRSLCLAGGVAHNCTLNGRILQCGLFERVFVQPAAHDAGGALGSACRAFYGQLKGARPGKMQHVYVGTGVGAPEEVESVLARWNRFIRFQRCDDFVMKTAQMIAEGAVVGWVQGRSEFGPRALGNRSILADPRPASNKDLINELVKKREQFRPFAPAVAEERVRDFFEIPSCEADLSFMTFSLPVKIPLREYLGAVTHIDGTARLQTVSRNTNPLFWALLNAFAEITNFPILLNTSFNNDVEPIVDSLDDAVTCFLTTGIDVLIIGDFIIHKEVPTHEDRSWLELVPSLPPARRLVHCTRRLKEVFLIESTKGTRHRRMETELSASAFRLLSEVNGWSKIGELLSTTGTNDHSDLKSLIPELISLWSRRMIALKPATT